MKNEVQTRYKHVFLANKSLLHSNVTFFVKSVSNFTKKSIPLMINYFFL